MEHTLGNDLIQKKLHQLLCFHRKSPDFDSMHQPNTQHSLPTSLVSFIGQPPTL